MALFPINKIKNYNEMKRKILFITLSCGLIMSSSFLKEKDTLRDLTLNNAEAIAQGEADILNGPGEKGICGSNLDGDICTTTTFFCLAQEETYCQQVFCSKHQSN